MLDEPRGYRKCSGRVAEVRATSSLFVASPSQSMTRSPAGRSRPTSCKFPDGLGAELAYQRPPNWAGLGWDAILLDAAAVEKPGGRRTETCAMRGTMDNFQGPTGIYHMSVTSSGHTENPCMLRTIVTPS